MKKYKVCGMVTVNVTKEVWANSEDEAREKAYNLLPCLTAYCGNGGYDKLVGVEGYDETVEVFEDIAYDEVEELEDDPDHFECPNCDAECDACEQDDGTEYWHCPNCGAYYDSDGDEFYPDDEEDE
jgi:predicted RNA-binding Zn-ribbon protein involved in translation (DUF1610 family)